GRGGSSVSSPSVAGSAEVVWGSVIESPPTSYWRTYDHVTAFTPSNIQRGCRRERVSAMMAAASSTRVARTAATVRSRSAGGPVIEAAGRADGVTLRLGLALGEGGRVAVRLLLPSAKATCATCAWLGPLYRST